MLVPRRTLRRARSRVTRTRDADEQQAHRLRDPRLGQHGARLRATRWPRRSTAGGSPRSRWARAPTALAAEFGVDCRAVGRGACSPATTSTSSSSPRRTRPTCRLPSQAAAAGKHVYLEKPMALDVAECDQIIDACRRAGVQLTIAKQTRHMEMSMRAKAVHRRGPDRRDPVPPADERDARAPASSTSRRAGRPTPARATRSSTGARMPATRSAGSPAPSRSASTPTTRTSPACRSRARRRWSRSACRTGRSPRSCCATRSGRRGSGRGATTSTRSSARRARSSGTSTGSSSSTGARDEQVWELPSWTLPDFKPRDPRRIGNTARQVDDFIAALRAGASRRRSPARTAGPRSR